MTTIDDMFNGGIGLAEQARRAAESGNYPKAATDLHNAIVTLENVLIGLKCRVAQ